MCDNKNYIKNSKAIYFIYLFILYIFFCNYFQIKDDNLTKFFFFITVLNLLVILFGFLRNTLNIIDSMNCINVNMD